MRRPRVCNVVEIATLGVVLLATTVATVAQYQEFLVTPRRVHVDPDKSALDFRPKGMIGGEHRGIDDPNRRALFAKSRSYNPRVASMLNTMPSAKMANFMRRFGGKKMGRYLNPYIAHRGFANYDAGRRYSREPSTAQDEYNAVRRALAMDRAVPRFSGETTVMIDEPLNRFYDPFHRPVPKITEAPAMPMVRKDQEKIESILHEISQQLKRYNDKVNEFLKQIQDPVELHRMIGRKTARHKDEHDKPGVKEDETDKPSQRMFIDDAKYTSKIDRDVDTKLRFYTDEFKLDGAKDEPSHRMHTSDMSAVGEKKSNKSDKHVKSEVKNMRVIEKVLSKINANVKARSAKAKNNDKTTPLANAESSSARKAMESLPVAKPNLANRKKITDSQKKSTNDHAKDVSLTATPATTLNEMPLNRIDDSNVPEWRHIDSRTRNPSWKVPEDYPGITKSYRPVEPVAEKNATVSVVNRTLSQSDSTNVNNVTSLDTAGTKGAMEN